MSYGATERGMYFQDKVRERGIADWGRTKSLADQLSVSYAASKGWFEGAIPRSPDDIVKVADYLGLDISEWISGRKSTSIERSKLDQSVRIVKEFEKEANIILSPEQMAELITHAYFDTGAGNGMLSQMASMFDFSTKKEVDISE
jgi:transcriptional regulator with XRE-family HTH domain